LKKDFQDQLFIYPLDVSIEESRQLLFDQIRANTNQLDMLINNAGIASGSTTHRLQFGELEQNDLSYCLLVNSVAQLMMTQQFIPLLKKGAASIVANISSNSGSITLKRGGGNTGYGYSASKAALNMMSKMLSHELKDDGVIVIALHPGWVKTTMLYTDNAPLEPEESIEGMIKLLESLTLESSGKFLDWQGNELPW
jgi:NAD(P)-dependent dehydrogenase (short-subunit alcohol dehydrogenase family)